MVPYRKALLRTLEMPSKKGSKHSKKKSNFEIDPLATLTVYQKLGRGMYIICSLFLLTFHRTPDTRISTDERRSSSNSPRTGSSSPSRGSVLIIQRNYPVERFDKHQRNMPLGSSPQQSENSDSLIVYCCVLLR